jgi:DNA-binding NtrC family response regulator
VHVLPIELPPLRERPDDTLALAEHFLRLKTAELGRTILGFTPEARTLIRAYRWPGNVRELENAVERATILCDGAWIDEVHLPERLRAPVGEPMRIGGPDSDSAPLPITPLRTPAPMSAKTLADSLRDPERDLLLKALAAHGWNRSKAAVSLGINRTTLYRKMRDLGLHQLGEAG